MSFKIECNDCKKLYDKSEVILMTDNNKRILVFRCNKCWKIERRYRDQ